MFPFALSIRVGGMEGSGEKGGWLSKKKINLSLIFLKSSPTTVQWQFRFGSYNPSAFASKEEISWRPKHAYTIHQNKKFISKSSVLQSKIETKTRDTTKHDSWRIVWNGFFNVHTVLNIKYFLQLISLNKFFTQI